MFFTNLTNYGNLANLGFFKKGNYMKKLLIALSTFATFSAFAQINVSNPPASNDNVVTLPSGVVVKVTNPGNSTKPTASSSVEVHYKGYFKDGKEFDSSYKRGETITFPLGNVIPCWTQGMQQLGEGGKATLFCPSDTAYGSRGAAGAVPPNTDLYFDVELIKVK